MSINRELDAKLTGLYRKSTSRLTLYKQVTDVILNVVGNGRVIRSRAVRAAIKKNFNLILILSGHVSITPNILW